MLLGLDNLDEGAADEMALKAIIQFKDTTIEQLEKTIDEDREKHERKLEKERAQHRTSINFLKHQIELKDDRITLLLNAVEKQSEQFQSLFSDYRRLSAELSELKDAQR